MENMPEFKNTISVAEAAREMGFTLDYVYKLIWAGKIKAEKIDGKWRVEKNVRDAGSHDKVEAGDREGRRVERPAVPSVQEAEKPAFGLSAVQFLRDELVGRGGQREESAPEQGAVPEQQEAPEMCPVTAYDGETGETYRCGLTVHSSRVPHTKGERIS